ncbi:hypothetical protein [Amycolatopsis sp. BJA-103]|nr:hypothetical protein [Amycolatopsis sp. BJA-103]
MRVSPGTGWLARPSLGAMLLKTILSFVLAVGPAAAPVTPEIPACR